MRNLFFSLIVLAGVPNIMLAKADQETAQRPELYQAPTVPSNSGYAAPAEINIGQPGDIDFFIDASFLYWQPQQDNMSVGLVQKSTSVTGTPNSYLSNYFVQLNPGFTPGFQVGLGMNLQKDDWEGLVGYARWAAVCFVSCSSSADSMSSSISCKKMKSGHSSILLRRNTAVILR